MLGHESPTPGQQVKLLAREHGLSGQYTREIRVFMEVLFDIELRPCPEANRDNHTKSAERAACRTQVVAGIYGVKHRLAVSRVRCDANFLDKIRHRRRSGTVRRRRKCAGNRLLG